MSKTRTIIIVAPDSQVAILSRKLRAAGIEPNERDRDFIFAADKERDRFAPTRLPSDLGAGIPPIRQPSKRKGGDGRGQQESDVGGGKGAQRQEDEGRQVFDGRSHGTMHPGD